MTERWGRTAASRGTRALSLSLALLAAATAADLLGVAAGLALLWTAGAQLGTFGVLAGAFAVGLRLPALLRAERSRGVRFALLAVLGLAIFALAVWIRGDAGIPPDPAVLLAEAVATALVWLARRTDRARPAGPGAAHRP